MEELRSAVLKRELDKAVEIADSLDLRKIKDNTFLSIVAEAYEKTKNYEDAKEALLLAYENTNAGRLIAYKLCLLSIKTKSFEDAQNYYEDFVDMAPRDTTRYILKYRMAKAQNKPLEELIAILEEYVNIDME
jgi:tetratricopeptide (TPR) repeat protein